MEIISKFQKFSQGISPKLQESTKLKRNVRFHIYDILNENSYTEKQTKVFQNEKFIQISLKT